MTLKEYMELRMGKCKQIKVNDYTKEQIKQELHKLVEGLDFGRALNDEDCNTIDNKICTLDYVKLLLQLRQKPKEKTLEQKLIDAGFEQSRSFSNIYAKNKINIWLATHNEFVETSCGADRLRCNLNDHDQIFADIAYLESRIK